MAASTVAGGSGDLGALTLVSKARQPLSVASMVRRFERDSSLDAPRTRGGGGGFKSSGKRIFLNGAAQGWGREGMQFVTLGIDHKCVIKVERG